MWIIFCWYFFGMMMTDKPWLKSYPKEVPAEINPHSFVSLVDLMEKSCQLYHDAPAFTLFNKTLTYGEIAAKSLQVAGYFQQILKLKPGSRVAIMLPNILQF